jgi:hypothetical protein
LEGYTKSLVIPSNVQEGNVVLILHLQKDFMNILSNQRKKDILDNPHEREVKSQATSLRQTSEWGGMHDFQSSFPTRVKDSYLKKAMVNGNTLYS